MVMITALTPTPKGTYTGDYFSFTVDFQDPCSLATLTLDPTTLSSTPFTYIIGDTSDV